MRAPVFRSPSPMQNPCSSSPFFLSLSKNSSKTISNGEDDCYGVNWVFFCMSRYMANIKTKQSKNRRKSKRHAKGKPHNRGKTAHHGRGADHGQTVAATTGRGVHHGLAVWPLVVVAWFCCSAAFWCPSVLRLGPRGLPFLGVFWASSCYHLLILMALTSLSWIHLKHFSQNPVSYTHLTLPTNREV